MKRIFFLYMIATAMFITSCNNDDDSIDNFDQVVTKHDVAYWDANSPSTYFLDTTVRWLENPNGAGNTNPNITRDFDTAILNSIEENMNKRGYTKVDEIDQDNLPDLIMSAQALATTTEDIDLIWDQWYDWWGTYNPYYPGGVYPIYYVYTLGTVLIEMGDGKSLNEDAQTINIVWGGGINGLVRDGQQGNLDFVQDRIDDAFDQSNSYL